MKLIYQLCLTLFFAGILTSCGDKLGEDVQSEAAFDHQISASGILTRMEVPIFFYAVEEDVVTHEKKGWIIDFRGKVRTYDMTDLNYTANTPKGSECSSTQIDVLLSLATTEKMTVDPNTLLQKVREIQFAENGALTEPTTNENMDKTYQFYGFQKVEGPNSMPNGSCGGGSHSSNSQNDVYELVLLKSEGAYQQTNESAAAKALVDWMKALETDVIL